MGRTTLLHSEQKPLLKSCLKKPFSVSTQRKRVRFGRHHKKASLVAKAFTKPSSTTSFTTSVVSNNISLQETNQMTEALVIPKTQLNHNDNASTTKIQSVSQKGHSNSVVQMDHDLDNFVNDHTCVLNMVHYGRNGSLEKLSAMDRLEIGHFVECGNITQNQAFKIFTRNRNDRIRAAKCGEVRFNNDCFFLTEEANENLKKRISVGFVLTTRIPVTNKSTRNFISGTIPKRIWAKNFFELEWYALQKLTSMINCAHDLVLLTCTRDLQMALRSFVFCSHVHFDFPKNFFRKDESGRQAIDDPKRFTFLIETLAGELPSLFWSLYNYTFRKLSVAFKNAQYEGNLDLIRRWNRVVLQPNAVTNGNKKPTRHRSKNIDMFMLDLYQSWNELLS